MHDGGGGGKDQKLPAAILGTPAILAASYVSYVMYILYVSSVQTVESA
jgi:hypothetical protein